MTTPKLDPIRFAQCQCGHRADKHRRSGRCKMLDRAALPCPCRKFERAERAPFWSDWRNRGG